MKLRISDDLVLGSDLVVSTAGIFATKGLGKTHLAQVMAEEMLAHGQVIVAIDPTDAWYGLRSSADGKSDGYPVVVIGGDHGDLKLEPGGGVQLAEAVVAERFSCVICTDGLSDMAETKFVREFLDTVYRRNREPIHIFVDEADVFCLDSETEILTAEGWRRQDQIDIGTVAVTFDLANAEYRYEPVSAVSRRLYDGPMLRLRSDGIDSIVTPNHRVVLRRSQRAAGRARMYDWTFCSAASVPHHIYVPLGGAPAGSGVALSDDMLRLVGWIATDGYFAGTRGGGIPRRYLGIQQAHATTKRGRSMVAELDGLLARLNAKSRTERPARKSGKGGGPSVSYYLGRELSAKVLAWTGDEIHRVPRPLITGCSRSQLESLMQGLLEGDGTADRASGQWRIFYAGLNEGLADDVQEIALRLGISATKRHVPQNGQWTVLLSRRSHHYIRKPQTSEYSGVVWCVTVPSGAFVARRHGKVFVTGNSPQKAFDVEDNRCIRAMSHVVRRGRKKGIGTTLITQRPAELNASVRTMVDMLFVLGMSHNLDIDAVERWLRLRKKKQGNNEAFALQEEMIASLDSLQRGDAWVWAPRMKIHKRFRARAKRTFDSGATPKPGQKVKAPKKLAPVDLQRLGQAMAAAVQRQKDNDPTELRKQLVALRKELDRVGRGQDRAEANEKENHAESFELRQRVHVLEKELAAVKKLKEKKVEVVRPADLRRLEALEKKIDKLVLRVTGASEDLELHLSGLRAEATKLQEVAGRVTQIRGAKAGALVGEAPARASDLPLASPAKGNGVPSAKLRDPQMKKIARRMEAASRPPINGHAVAAPVDLKPVHLRFLSAIAWWESIGVPAPDLGGVAFVAGTSAASSAFDNNRSRLRAAGYIDYPSSGRVSLTEAGRAISPPPALPPTNDALHEAVFLRLTPVLGRMLRPLIEAYPRELSLEDLAERAGTSTKSSAFDNNRSWLRARGLAEYPRTGFVRATALLFPEVS